MNYNVDFDSLDSMYNSVEKQANSWIAELKAIKEKFKTLANTSNMAGVAANNIKSYIGHVHIILIGLLSQLIALHSSNCLLYKAEYQTRIDNGLHSVIKAAELLACKDKINTTRAQAIDIDNHMSYVLNNIRDIFYVSHADISAVDYAHISVSRFLTTLDSAIQRLEDKHYNNDFDNTSQLINALRMFIREQASAGRTYRTNFALDNLASSAAFLNLYASHIGVTKELKEKSCSIDTALENENQRVTNLQKEYEKRQQKAAAVEWLVTGVVIIASVAVIASTGGAATPVVIGAVSAFSGAVIAGTDNLANQYVQHGNLIDNSDEIDWESFKKDTALAAIAGFAAGVISAGMSSAITSELSNTVAGEMLLHSSSQAVRIGTAATIGAISETSTGIMTRGVETYITSEGDVREAFIGALDAKDIAADFVIGGIGGSVNQYTSTKEAQKAADDAVSKYNKRHNPLKDGEKHGIKGLKQTPNGGVDFSDSDCIFRTESGEPVQFKIKATGKRLNDYKAAEQMYKDIYGDDLDLSSLRGKNGAYVWHHLDDYNVATNETTLQFIDKNAHIEIRNHAGSVKQYRTANGTGYKKDNFDVYYGFDPTESFSAVHYGISDYNKNISNVPEADFNRHADIRSTISEYEELMEKIGHVRNLKNVTYENGKER